MSRGSQSSPKASPNHNEEQQYLKTNSPLFEYQNQGLTDLRFAISKKQSASKQTVTISEASDGSDSYAQAMQVPIEQTIDAHEPHHLIARKTDNAGNLNKIRVISHTNNEENRESESEEMNSSDEQAQIRVTPQI